MLADGWVTDVLVEERGKSGRGSPSNRTKTPGARFSYFGASALVRRARDDGDLALVRLVAPRHAASKARQAVSWEGIGRPSKKQLVGADPRRAALIKSMVARASDEIQAKARAGSNDFVHGHVVCHRLHASESSAKRNCWAFTNEGNFDKVVAALSLMCDLPIGLVERSFAQNLTEQILVLARAIDISWVNNRSAVCSWTARAHAGSRQRLDQCFTQFSRLAADED